MRNKYGKMTDAQKIIKIAHTRNDARKMLKYMSPYAITLLYNKIPFVLNNGTLKGQARKAISNFFKKKYGLFISKTFTLRIPSRRGITRKQIKRYKVAPLPVIFLLH